MELNGSSVRMQLAGNAEVVVLLKGVLPFANPLSTKKMSVRR